MPTVAVSRHSSFHQTQMHRSSSCTSCWRRLNRGRDRCRVSRMTVEGTMMGSCGGRAASRSICLSAYTYDRNSPGEEQCSYRSQASGHCCRRTSSAGCIPSQEAPVGTPGNQCRSCTQRSRKEYRRAHSVHGGLMSDVTHRWSLHCRTFPRAVFFRNLFCARGASAL